MTANWHVPGWEGQVPFNNKTSVTCRTITDEDLAIVIDDYLAWLRSVGRSLTIDNSIYQVGELIEGKWRLYDEVFPVVGGSGSIYLKGLKTQALGKRSCVVPIDCLGKLLPTSNEYGDIAP